MRRPASPTRILAVISFGIFIAADDLTVVSTMLRQMIYDLQIPLPDGMDQAAWIVNAYLIAYVVVMPFIGRASDLWGRRPVYLGAMILFLLGSVWVPFATSYHSFLFGRVLTALGGGAMVPVGMAILADVWQKEKLPSALGILGAVDTAGWIWGPLYGALLIQYLSWHWQFYLNIPLSLIGLILGWYALQDLPPPTNKGRIDWLGTAVLTLSLLTFNIALLNSGDISAAGSLSQLQQDQSATTLPLYLTALLSMGFFLWRQHQLKQKGGDPFLDLTLFQRPNFSPAILINFFIGFVLIAAMVNIPFIINLQVADITAAAADSGSLLATMTAAMAVAAYAGGKLTERWYVRPIILTGVLLCLAAFALMGSQWVFATSQQTMRWHLLLLGIGFGLVTAPLGTAVIDAATETERGVASSLVIVMRLIGMSVGLSTLTSWGIYRFNLLRTQIELPPFTDPGYMEALFTASTHLSIQTLTESFLWSAVILLIAAISALFLRKKAV